MSETKPKMKASKGSKPTKRYFDDPVPENELKKVKLKPKSEQKFSGEIIKVEQHKMQKLKPNITRNQKPQKLQNRVKKPKIPKHLLEKHTRGAPVEQSGVKTKFFKEKQKRKEIYLEYATEQAARTELLQIEENGFIEADEDEITANYRQEDIVRNVDIQSAAKHFDLKLDYGPYHMRYTRNGRNLLLGGHHGHVAAFDWVTKKLNCEFNVMEEVADVSWLHVNTMFACAQKKWVYIYDNRGIELHCVKALNNVNCMEFLQYHFLLATANMNGYLSWLDVSVGELIGDYGTRLGDIRIMRQNPGNGVLCVGGGNGVVSMWSPKVRKPLAKLLCHHSPLTALTVDPKGQYLVTAGVDHLVKVWDVRALSGPLASYKLRYSANQVEVSQRGMLAISQGPYLEMYSSLVFGASTKAPYLRHNCKSLVHGMRFCPYEDVLGVATADGFESLLAPGSGEPNFDAYEENPYQTLSQRREHEVHALLEKIPPELITLDPSEIAAVDTPTLQEKVDAKRALFYLKPPQIDFKSRHKMKGRGGSAKASKNKQIVKDLKRKEFIKEIRKAKEEVIREHKVTAEDGDDFIPLDTQQKSKPSVLDRFKPKKKKT